ncbi:PREDICTED: lysosome membrane protein 2-like [Amphimedon queenslandica]|uniref:Scavenger receptor class B member 1 n=1 Tax=Amphimedon queenslandica TaxID=400682 RepID=A0A1X7UKN0_AMPQE|nr:PREDICTED: lysosome membrane protein 2-like [Amphimedon queenslandica]|eukprot:XP_003387595.1 PREDICTED: lysosome membrane protein 2-like [Amphimedon queenslandica]
MLKSRRICCCVCGSGCTVVSLILLSLAIALIIEFPSLLDHMVNEKLTILPGHSSYEQLKDPSLPVYKDVYFFNLTNPVEFSQGARPIVNEVGPYSYREYRIKYFNTSDLLDGDNVLQYTQRKTFHFSSSTSQNNTSETDTICTINIPLVGAITQVLGLENKALRFLGKMLLKAEIIIRGAKLYVCQPASALVFNYTDPLIQWLHSSNDLRRLGLNLPTDYVSLQKNNSADDSLPSKIYTGHDDISKLGQFIQWNNLTNLGIWPGDTANKINGTEGLVFRPGLKEGDSLFAFVDDTVRSFPLEYNGSIDIKGLPAFRYALPMEVFDSAFKNEDNARWGSWCPDGLIYLGVIQTPSVPVFGSKARFLDCEPEQTRDQVDGMLVPHREMHDTFINVHPTIGINIQFQRILQLNVQVNRTDEFKELKNINGTIYYPVLYINEHAELTDDFKSYLMKNGLHQITVATDVMYGGYAFLFVVAFIVLLAAVVCFWKARSNRRRQEYQAIPCN